MRSTAWFPIQGSPIIGAGIGGLALAGFLEKLGANVTIYEQAKAFQRVGAGMP